jgi:hypothetical protein
MFGDRHAEGNGYLGVSTCLPSVLSRDGVWVSSTERFIYVSPQVDDGLLLLISTFATLGRSLCPRAQAT